MPRPVGLLVVSTAVVGYKAAFTLLEAPLLSADGTLVPVVDDGNRRRGLHFDKFNLWSVVDT